MPLSLLDFLFPKRSLTGKEGQWVTEEEREELLCRPVILSRQALMHRGLQSLDRVVAASRYDASPLLQQAVRTFKYKRIGSLQTDLGRMLAQASQLSWTSVVPVLCPVPLHWARLYERGFNQAELLAEAVARARGCAVRPLVQRRRPTGHQAWRKREERFTAVRDAFEVRGSLVPPFVVLVDDLTTTGATLDMCAKALKQAGAKRVEGLVLALG